MGFFLQFIFALGFCALLLVTSIFGFARDFSLSPYTFYKVDVTYPGYTDLTGVYVKNRALGIYKNGGCGDVDCVSSTNCKWNGTWMYQYSSPTTTYYLYEVYRAPSLNYRAYINTVPCAPVTSFSVRSPDMKNGTLLGKRQDFTEATQVANWFASGGSPITMSPSSSAQIKICASGTGCTTSSPTRHPTRHPTKKPSRAPTLPTKAPIAPTDAPTKLPTTPRPTSLPTETTVIYSSTACTGLKVSGLGSIFQGQQTDYRFNVLTPVEQHVSDSRRMWSNGQGVRVYFSKRWYPAVGVWVVSNGSLSLVQNRTQATFDAPGSSSGVYGLWDHFTNDNVYQPIQSRITLRMTCFSDDTAWPTSMPTKKPTKAPTTTTVAPTSRPTSVCWTLELIRGQSTCPGHVAGGLAGIYVKRSTTFNGKMYFTGVDDTSGNTIFWSDHFLTWVIDGESSIGYSALAPASTDDFPPQSTEWSLFEQTNTFALDCEITFEYNCYSYKTPTISPTNAPLTAAPTRSTRAPTKLPTRKPTKRPTRSPTRSPSRAPTSAPVDKCDGITVKGTHDGLSQRYQIARSGTIAGKNYWNAVVGDGQIFFSTSVLHKSWVINSATLGIYWLAKTPIRMQPPLSDMWSKYVGTSPFSVNTTKLTLTCNRNWFPTPHPTRHPTKSPTRSPSFSPTRHPTKAPTKPPTDAPTDMPTRTPSYSPTRHPTRQPTPAPTNAPTQPPTRQVCLFLALSGIKQFDGTYEKVGSDLMPVHGGWQNVDNINKNITYISGSWVLNDWSENPDLNNSYALESTDWRPPDEGTWHKQYMDSNSQWHQGKSVLVRVSCDFTKWPTAAPTRSPTNLPTRSHCNGLLVSNLTSNVAPGMLGWYRKQPYSINGKWWWINDDHTWAVKFFDHWWVLQPISGGDTATAPNRLLTNDSSYDDRPPVVSSWFYAKDPSLVVQLSLGCDSSAHPSIAPTFRPTIVPSSNKEPLWTSCPDKQYFVFTTSDSPTSVEWEEPTVTDDQEYTVSLEVRAYSSKDEFEVIAIPENNLFDPGYKYEFRYVATDTLGASSPCTIVVYVVQSPYESFDYCLQSGFAIAITVNEDGYTLEDPEDITYDEDDGPIIGEVRLQTLIDDEQNCFVNARLVNKVSNDDSAFATSSYLGVKGATIMWQIFVLLLVLCVFVLFGEAIRVCVKNYRDRNKKEEDESLLPVDATAEDTKAIMAGLPPEKAVRKATLQSTLAPNKGEGVNSALTVELALAQTKPEEERKTDTFDIAKAPASLQKPAQEAPAPTEALKKVPESEDFWREALEELDLRKFRNREKNLELLIKYAVHKSDGSVDVMETANKVDEQLQKMLAKKKQAQQANSPEQSQPPPPSLPPPISNLPPPIPNQGAPPPVPNKNPSIPPPLPNQIPSIPPPIPKKQVEDQGDAVVTDMLERDWEEAGLDKNEGDPEAVSTGNLPMKLPSPPKAYDSENAPSDSEADEPDSERRQNKRQSEFNL